MSATESPDLIKIDGIDDLVEGQRVLVSLNAWVEVDAVDEEWVTFSDSEGENTFQIAFDSNWTHESLFSFAQERIRDIREVRELVANPASVSNRKLRGLDPYGNVFEIAFQGSIGFNVYPSGTVTISEVGDVLSDVFYIQNGINGTLEVI